MYGVVQQHPVESAGIILSRKPSPDEPRVLGDLGPHGALGVEAPVVEPLAASRAAVSGPGCHNIY